MIYPKELGASRLITNWALVVNYLFEVVSMNIEVWNEVGNRIQNPNDACQFISTLMVSCEDKTFNDLITADFTNPPSQIYGAICAFHSESNKIFDVKAVYLEMNGFGINPNRWYFDFFGYESTPPNDDSLDWLSHWQSPDYPTITLTGLEPYKNFMPITSVTN